MNESSVSRGRSLFIWGLCCSLAGGVFLVYLAASLAAGQGQILMPLDDVYIHFQYAHQIAAGQPYVYNPGLPPTSGATSFLYPYLLAIGDLIGFDGLNLGLWAMGLGALALAGSTWLVYRLGRLYTNHGLSLLIAVAFALNGPMSWHFLSGMETGLVILFVLWTLYGLMTRHALTCVIGATLLALIRPEGGVLAILAMGALYLQIRTEKREAASLGDSLGFAWLLVPVLAIGVQPLVNLVLTKSIVASGNQSKSIFGMVPPYQDAIVGRLLSNFTREWVELVTGYNAREGWYIPFTLSLLALIAFIRFLRGRSTRISALLILAWLVAGTAVIATLDTAFWHFKRYQMPLIVLLFPLAAWGLGLFPRRAPLLRNALVAVTLVGSLLTLPTFIKAFALNAGYVRDQPLQMAEWVQLNTSPESVVAVHDTGLLRYLGGRTTIDIVGLTTPGAAESWRNGPGSVAEMLDALRPNYIASYGYGHGFGLGYLADTDLYKNALAVYPLTLDNKLNVALAADTQGVYAPDWTAADRSTRPWQPSTWTYIGAGPGMPLATVDVADLVSEQAHDYRWSDSERLGGFPTDVYEFGYIACDTVFAGQNCTVMDGGRHINGEESFDLIVPNPGAGPLLLVTRVHPANAGTIDVYANGTLVGTRVIPALPGSWLELATLIPPDAQTSSTRIRIVPHTPGGYYMPYMHWLYPARIPPLPDEDPFATFQDGAIQVYDPQITVDEDARRLDVSLTWGTPGGAQGDYKVFVHVLDSAGSNVAQADIRPGANALPPGNWLPGSFRDIISVDVTGVPAGTYQVVMGLYNPDTLDRLIPTNADELGRLYLGDMEIGGG